ncbi:MAG: RNA polymerase sigma factor [Longimicrobiales bacterium]
MTVPSSDVELITGLRAGDERAFEAVFRAYHARLCSYAYRYLRQQADADEVVQDLFLALWQKRDALVIRSSLRAYLFAATHHRVLNRSARARLEQRWLQEGGGSELDIPDEAAPADEVLAGAQLAARVQAALDALPPGCRRVLQLRWLDQLSYVEIAEVLGISTKGVENQLARARKALRVSLG